MSKKKDVESVHLINHSKCMMAAFHNFRMDETMLDVTLVCDGNSLKAHKLVLSACSPFFKQIFADNPCSHPVIILRNFDFTDLKAVIDFIYKGELSVPRERLMSALKVAEELSIRGLVRNNEHNPENYQKMYSEVCKKKSNKKRPKKRRRSNSSDSCEKSDSNSSDSDVVDSDSSEDHQSMDVEEAVDIETSDDESVNKLDEESENRLVNRVQDPTITEDDLSKPAEAEESGITTTVENHSTSDIEENSPPKSPKNEILEAVLEETPKLPDDSVVTYSENSDSILEGIALEHDSLQDAAEQFASELLTSSNGSVNQIEVSSSSFLPAAESINENDRPVVGKRFVCSKCNSVFTSRITFMRHKVSGHSNKEQHSYVCQYCEFSTTDQECLRSHLADHESKMPYECNLCTAVFMTEAEYKEHSVTHEEQDIPLSEISVEISQDSTSPAYTDEDPKYFNCTICFKKFKNQMACQIHESFCRDKCYQ